MGRGGVEEVGKDPKKGGEVWRTKVWAGWRSSGRTRTWIVEGGGPGPQGRGVMY